MFDNIVNQIVNFGRKAAGSVKALIRSMPLLVPAAALLALLLLW